MIALLDHFTRSSFLHVPYCVFKFSTHVSLSGCLVDWHIARVVSTKTYAKTLYVDDMFPFNILHMSQRFSFFWAYYNNIMISPWGRHKWWLVGVIWNPRMYIYIYIHLYLTYMLSFTFGRHLYHCIKKNMSVLGNIINSHPPTQLIIKFPDGHHGLVLDLFMSGVRPLMVLFNVVFAILISISIWLDHVTPYFWWWYFRVWWSTWWLNPHVWWDGNHISYAIYRKIIISSHRMIHVHDLPCTYHGLPCDGICCICSWKMKHLWSHPMII